jgi:hypothetical protein
VGTCAKRNSKIADKCYREAGPDKCTNRGGVQGPDKYQAGEGLGTI